MLTKVCILQLQTNVNCLLAFSNSRPLVSKFETAQSWCKLMRVDASWCKLAVKRKRDLQLATCISLHQLTSSFDRGFRKSRVDGNNNEAIIAFNSLTSFVSLPANSTYCHINLRFSTLRNTIYYLATLEAIFWGYMQITKKYRMLSMSVISGQVKTFPANVYCVGKKYSLER